MAQVPPTTSTDTHSAAADAAAGDVLARLVADHHAALYRYAYRLTGSAPDAEDLTQQAFLIAKQKLDQLRSPECGQSWLFTILRHAYLHGFRRRRPVGAGSVGVDLNQIPAFQADESIDGEALQRALDALPDDFRVVVLLFYFEQLSYSQIADQLDLPQGTVMSRLSRAKAQLRARLGEPDQPETEKATHTRLPVPPVPGNHPAPTATTHLNP